MSYPDCHGRPWPGHPPLPVATAAKTRVAGPGPGHDGQGDCGSDAGMSTTIAAPAVARTPAMPQSPAQLALRRFLHRPVAVAGLIVIVLFIGVAILAHVIAPYDPVATSWTAIRKAPSLAHWMGTDENGRDVLSRVIFGARASLLAGVVSVLIAAGIGVPAGLMAGFAGGWIDVILSRIVDAMLACPFLILAIALAAFLGPDLTNAMIAIGVSTAPRFMRVARAATLDASSNDYVEAARAIGNPAWRVAVRHVLPNIVPPIMVQGTLAIAAAIIAEASLSFLGLGQQPPDPSWGSMLNSAQRFLSQAPWLAVFPGLAIFLAVLSFNLVGDGLRDALDPRGR
jgi:peptide/nickel transport system permease protein